MDSKLSTFIGVMVFYILLSYVIFPLAFYYLVDKSLSGAGNGFGAWPAYRVSNGQMWGAQLRLNDCYRQQRFPYPIFGSDATIALGVYMGVNGKGGATVAPAIKR